MISSRRPASLLRDFFSEETGIWYQVGRELDRHGIEISGPDFSSGRKGNICALALKPKVNRVRIMDRVNFKLFLNIIGISR
jgi:hypothetical protein